MARILAISSQVASGHVGLSAMVPALQALGHEVIALPTILLANHPGRLITTGTRIDPDVLERMVDTLEANGRLDGVDAVVSGYLPSAQHVALAAMAVGRCRAINPHLVYLCDPVIGDDPKGIYIDAAAAATIRDHLVGLADIITPNRFELGWLTQSAVGDPDTAVAAARSLGVAVTVSTSVPNGTDELATLCVTNRAVNRASVARRARVPSGTGDLLAALFLGRLLNDGDHGGVLGEVLGKSLAEALAFAVAGVDHVLEASGGADEMQLVGTLAPWIIASQTPK